MADTADTGTETSGPPPEAVLAALGLAAPASVTEQPSSDATVTRADLTDGRTVAIRVLRHEVHPDRELAALQLAAEYGHPAPRLIATGTVTGRAAIVTTWCTGRPIGELLCESADATVLGHAFGHTQAGLHRRMDDGTVLCHLDYHPYNVLAEHDAVTGIVDWSNARAGEAAEDLATTAVILELAPAIVPELAACIDVFTGAWRAGYAELRTIPDDDQLAPFLARAAQLQLDTWRPRATASKCLPAVLDRAEAIAAHWQA